MRKRGRPPYPDILTPREWEVLGLVREGLTNEQIAERLNVTTHAARYHVSEILSKLGVDSRREAAAWEPERARPFWARALAFALWPVKHLPFGVAAKASAAVVVVGAAGGIGFLAWGVVVTGGPGGDNMAALLPSPTGAVTVTATAGPPLTTTPHTQPSPSVSITPLSSPTIPAATPAPTTTATPAPAVDASPTPEPATPTATAELPPVSITVTEKDAGTTIRLAVGEMFRIVLGGNVSTGFEWEFVQGLGAGIQQVGPTRIEQDRPIPGSGDTETFTLQALAPGTTLLELVWRQPWETGVPPRRTFQMTVVVDPPGGEGSGTVPPHVEPPPATLVASSGEQTGGTFNYCWDGLCVDALGVLVPKEALVARVGETVTFQLAIEPAQIELAAWPIDSGEIVQQYERLFAWRARGDGDTNFRYDLSAQPPFQFTPDFPPGQYVVVLSVSGVNYGFLLELGP